MSVAFHRGLTHELRLKLQQTGVRIEEIDAHRALAGLLTREIDLRGNPIKSPENQHAIRSDAAKFVEDAVADVLANRFFIMQKWESDHPDQNPFPPIFPEVVIAHLDREIEDYEAVVDEVLTLARAELLFG